MTQDNCGTGRFNNDLYEAALQAILAAGAPESVAENAARVVASDDPNLENFGRTDEDQEAVQHAWFYLVCSSGTVHD